MPICGGKVRHFRMTLTVAVNAGLALSATGNKCRYSDTVAKTLPAVNFTQVINYRHSTPMVHSITEGCLEGRTFTQRSTWCISESHRQDVVDERNHTREVSTHLNTGQPEKTTYSSASTAWYFPPRSCDFEVQLRIWGFFWKNLGFLLCVRNLHFA